MLTLADYYMGRERLHPDELTPHLQRNAACTLGRANRLLQLAGARAWVINSGWRPLAINACIPNASPRSRHITCEAIDLGDGDGSLDAWCIEHLETLASLGLWLEHPRATPGWCHVQTVPPRSGRRVFCP